MHIHILGICGTFMGGIAAIARESGVRVTGCDANVYPPMSDQLRALGIDLVEGFSADQLAIAPDVWIVGNVVSRGNPLMEAILAAGAPYLSGPQWLAENVLRGRHVLAVAGTHGKTTTSSMLAWILDEASRQSSDGNGAIGATTAACGPLDLRREAGEPGFLIGGVPGNFNVSARLGRSPLFVIEADEYDTAFFDKRSKFVHYQPRTAILNNLEFDHADIFADLAAIETQFHHLVRTMANSARLIVNDDEPALARVLQRGCWSERQAFNATDGWHASDVTETPAASEFDVWFGQQCHGRCRLELAGSHNRSNAIAAIAAAAHVGVAPERAIEALANFAGIRRRLETRGEVDGIVVIDDFAHHPTAIQTTIAGLRARLLPGQRILAVLEPRSNTMKLGAVKAALPGSLAAADLVYTFAGGVDWDVAQVMAPLGKKARTERDLVTLSAAIVADARAGDRILVMSNGSFGGIHEGLLEGLRGRTQAGARG